MGLFDKVKTITKDTSEKTSKMAGRVAVITKEAAASEVVAGIIDVGVDTTAGVVFDPLKKVVGGVGTIAKIVSSPGLTTAHEVASEVVNTTEEVVTEVAKDVLKKVVMSSGEKLTEKR